MFRVVLIGIAAAIPGVFVVPILLVRTPDNLRRHSPLEQPVQFDHRHHAGDDGIACVYCHSGAETTPHAGVPATEVCMGCHSQVWNQSPILEPVRRSYFSGQPLVWNRVHSVPDFVYFNHAIHVSRAKVACAECHGDVIAEPLVERSRLFTMGWCLDCHRQRERELQLEAPPQILATAETHPPLASIEATARIGTSRITTCTACHR
jgi:formate-dependent nitrite reductase cytochrome c552 subunit